MKGIKRNISNDILHFLSVASSFLIVFGSLMLIQQIIFGFIPNIMNYTVLGIPIIILLFIFNSLILMKISFRAYSPYK